MRLKAWRALKKLTLLEVADGIGAANPGVVEKHESGKRRPSADFQAKYHKFTEGAVTAQDWLDQHQEMKAARAGPAVCGRCDLRADDPQVRSCTAPDCGLREKEAA